MIVPPNPRLCFLLASCAIHWTSIGLAETLLQVGSKEELIAAITEAEPETTIEIAPGDYGALNIIRQAGGRDKPITLKGSNTENPPRFSSLNLRDAGHFVLDNLVFDYQHRPGDKIHLRPFQIIGSQDVTVRNTLFDGDLAVAAPDEEPSPTAFALGITSSSHVTISDSTFQQFFRGIVVAQSTNVVLKDNELHSLRMDGLNVAESRDILIESNHIHDFDRVLNSADHADFIQFWTNRTKSPSENITIRGNILNSGNGWYTQSIFMRNDQVDRGLAGREMYYRNILIEDNVIINAHLHGISVGETDGLIIRNNSVIRNSRSEGPDNNPTLWTPQIRVSPAANNVTISGNVTSKIEGFADQTDWSVQDNFFIQDREPEKPDYYDQVFVAARTGDPNQLANFAPLPGGPLDGKDFGSPILAILGKNLSTPLPVIRVKPDPSYPNRFAFDAELTRFPAQSDPETAIYSWDMGDGTRLEGPTVTHDYASVGTYDITFSSTLPGLDPEQSTTTVTIPKSDVLAFDPNQNAIIAGSGEVPLAITDPSITDGVIRLAKAQKPITVPSSLIAPLFGSRDFTLSFRLRGSGDYRNPGDILYIPKTLVISVTGRGALNVDIAGSDGQTNNVKSPGERLYDANWRDVEIAFSGRKKTISILIDGETVAERPFIGLPSTSKWDLIFGHTKEDSRAFLGELTDLRLTINTEGTEAAE